MRKIGVFVDISNLYFSINRKFPGQKLDYGKFIDYIRELGTVQIQVAYGAQIDDEARTFITYLRHQGFTTKYKTPKEWQSPEVFKRKADWDVGITVDAINMADRFDTVVLGSADSDLAPLVEDLVGKGIRVIILACRISRELNETASETIEIPESMLVNQEETIELQNGA